MVKVEQGGQLIVDHGVGRPVGSRTVMTARRPRPLRGATGWSDLVTATVEETPAPFGADQTGRWAVTRQAVIQPSSIAASRR